MTRALNMSPSQHRVRPSLRRQAGFSMIEVLVTMLLISLALLGTSGLQAYSMRLNQGGIFRSQAVFLAADLAERIEANKSGAVKGYYAPATMPDFQTPSTACVTAVCDDQGLANFDLSNWQNAVSQLPQSSWSVTSSTVGTVTTYTIQINWVDRLSNTNAPATASTVNTGSNGTGEKFSVTAVRSVSL
jgi:type IV pilus assembly protein PilV